MKDRIPKYPGRIKLIPVPGEANLYIMERADEPLEEGTKLNKKTLLTDETAEYLGLVGDPTVDEAFMASMYRVKNRPDTFRKLITGRFL